MLVQKPLWTSSEIVAATGGCCSKDDVSIRGVSIDTRDISQGDLFVALSGKNSDGHAYLEKAAQCGAVAALVKKGTVCDALTLIEVDDPFEGLEQMARHRRSFFEGKVIALTGSMGKTSTKEMLAYVLSRQAKIHYAEKSLNNHIGVPLTLARLPLEAEYAVMELGMNHIGEIESLSKMVEPHISIINNIASVHIENFPDLIDIAKAKSEIFLGMSHQGIAILNADTSFLDIQVGEARTQNLQKIRFFGSSEKADIKVLKVSHDIQGCHVDVELDGVPLSYTTKLFGEHQALNGLPVLLVIKELGLDVLKAALDLEEMAPVKGRGNRLSVSLDDGKVLSIIDDRHNASPDAMKAAFVTLESMHDPEKEELILVLGDMLELGEQSIQKHAELFEEMSKLNYSIALLCGKFMAHLAAKLPADKVRHFKDSQELSENIVDYAQDKTLFFVKGSRGSAMWHPINTLLDLDKQTKHEKVGA